MKRTWFIMCALIVAVLFSQSARSAELITNGGFETGTFAGWTATNASGFWFGWQAVASGFDTGGFFPPTSVPAGTREAFQGTASNANSPFTLDQTFTIPAATTASITWRHRFQVDLVGFCTSVATCGNVVYRVQILNTSNVVLQTLYTATAPALTRFDTGWQYHLRNLNAFAGQTIKIRFTTTASVTFAGPGQLEVDAVSVQSPAVVTAATATISGRLVTSDGQPVDGGVVTLTDGPDVRTAISNSFGYYGFDEVATGRTYVLGATAKRYFFPDSPVALSVTGNLSDVNFQASP